MSDLRFVRAHDRELSLWQSAVAEQVRSAKNDRLSAAAVLADPLMQATTDHVEAMLRGGEAAVPQPPFSDDRQARAYLSSLALKKGIALVEGDAERAGALDLEIRKYSDLDPGFLSIVPTFLEYYILSDGKPLYNDWTQQGEGQLDYGVVEWKLPNEGVVGIIGDWGTGLEDAKALLREVMQSKPAAIIHLGDIYYAGTERECQVNYAEVIATVFAETLPEGKRIPVFTLAGNHDYYAFGYGFYPTIAAINETIEGAKQVASYFCLRTEDGLWQFLAMDTGYADANPIDLVDPGSGPGLHATEVQWLHDKLDGFQGTTVLLSHNQLFSARLGLNDGTKPYLNSHLLEAFAPYFSDRIAAWMWGHEHNFAAFQNDLFGLAKGRLLGCSAYEEMTLFDPYEVKYPQVPYLDPVKYRVSFEGGYYNHAYALVDLKRAEPSAPLSISYYQFPSWGDSPPQSQEPVLILEEKLERPTN